MHSPDANTAARRSSVDMPGCWPGGFFADYRGAQILENAANHIWRPYEMLSDNWSRDKAAELMDDLRHQLYAQMEARDNKNEAAA